MNAATNNSRAILVPLDGSTLAEQAFPSARAVAAPGEELVLLQVVPEPESVYGALTPLILPTAETLDLWKHQARDDVERGALKLKGAGLEVHQEVVVGDPAEVILRLAAERGIELIVMTTHGRGALGRWAFGSVADRVARTATVPVLLVRPTDAAAPAAEIRRLIVPLDGSALAAEALPVATELAKRLNVPVLLLEAIDPTALLPPFVGIGEPLPPSGYEGIDARLEADARRTLDEAAARLRDAGVAVSSQVLVGPAAAGVLRAEQPGDLVVLTSHGRSGVTRWLLGSVAEKLVRLAPGPVLLVPSAERRRFAHEPAAAVPPSASLGPA